MQIVDCRIQATDYKPGPPTRRRCFACILQSAFYNLQSLAPAPPPVKEQWRHLALSSCIPAPCGVTYRHAKEDKER
jgi:hypothetical protein